MKVVCVIWVASAALLGWGVSAQSCPGDCGNGRCVQNSAGQPFCQCHGYWQGDRCEISTSKRGQGCSQDANCGPSEYCYTIDEISGSSKIVNNDALPSDWYQQYSDYYRSLTTWYKHKYFNLNHWMHDAIKNPSMLVARRPRVVSGGVCMCNPESIFYEELNGCAARGCSEALQCNQPAGGQCYQQSGSSVTCNCGSQLEGPQCFVPKPYWSAWSAWVGVEGDAALARPGYICEMARSRQCQNILEGVILGQFCQGSGSTDAIQYDRCRLADKCDSSNHGCMHDCVNQASGGFRCVCRSGFQLDTDGRSCTPVTTSRPMPSTTTTRPYCNGEIQEITGLSGTVETPRFGAYEADMNCVWRIQVPNDHYIVWTFKDFEVNSDTNCEGPDYVKFFIKFYMDSFRTVCGTQVPSGVRTQGSELGIRFTSDSSGSGKGFRAEWQAFPNQAVTLAPKPVGCGEGQFECATTKECIDATRVCDKFDDCPASEDEADCKRCPPGYMWLEIFNNCIDVDECSANLHHCEQRCINTRGSYECACHRGYQLLAESGQCADVNECTNGQATCQDVCLNTPGSYRCVCPTGFRYQSGRCVDVDECALATHACDHMCQNRNGTYRCYCHDGYRLDGGDGHSCLDVNECGMATRCPVGERCVNTQGTWSCARDTTGPGECDLGFVWNAGPAKCGDLDECQQNNGGCSQLCLNILGSHYCYCRPGYILHWDRATCVTTGTNEATSTALGDRIQAEPIQQSCDWSSEVLIERQGVTVCDCKPGLRRRKDGQCRDIDECATGMNVCEETCSNSEGSYTCGCPVGFRLNTDARSCSAIDECPPEHGCQQKCAIIWGSPRCFCSGRGWSAQSGGDATKCRDRDECLEEPCGAGATCVNKESGNGYECQCGEGLRLLSDNVTCSSQAQIGWSHWSAWSTCKANCSTKGERTRTRVCVDLYNKATPAVGCKGDDLEAQACCGARCLYNATEEATAVEVSVDVPLTSGAWKRYKETFQAGIAKHITQECRRADKFHICCPSGSKRSRNTDKLEFVTSDDIVLTAAQLAPCQTDSSFAVLVTPRVDNQLCTNWRQDLLDFLPAERVAERKELSDPIPHTESNYLITQADLIELLNQTSFARALSDAAYDSVAPVNVKHVFVTAASNRKQISPGISVRALPQLPPALAGSVWTMETRNKYLEKNEKSSTPLTTLSLLTTAYALL